MAPASTGRRPVIDTPNGTFEFAPHHCFACGTLNPAVSASISTSSPAGRWVELALEPRFEGWEGVIHGGILCDDPRRGHGLGTGRRGQLGRDGTDGRRLPQAGRGSACRSGPKAGSPDARRRVVDTAGHIVDAATGVELATATGVYVAASADQKARRSAIATPTGRAPPTRMEPSEPGLSEPVDGKGT